MSNNQDMYSHSSMWSQTNTNYNNNNTSQNTDRFSSYPSNLPQPPASPTVRHTSSITSLADFDSLPASIDFSHLPPETTPYDPISPYQARRTSHDFQRRSSKVSLPTLSENTLSPHSSMGSLVEDGNNTQAIPNRVISPSHKQILRSTSNRWTTGKNNYAAIPEEDSIPMILRPAAPRAFLQDPVAGRPQVPRQQEPIGHGLPYKSGMSGNYPPQAGGVSRMFEGLSRQFSRLSPRRSGTVTSMQSNLWSRNTEYRSASTRDMEPVTAAGYDISLFSGPEFTVNNAPTLTRASPLSEKAALPPDWKPFTMRRPYLIFLVVFSLAITITIETLYRVQKVDDGFFVPQNDNRSIHGRYLIVTIVPNIVSVIYSVLWQLTEYDVKRLEAFHQLSLPGGALASHSLNVDYVTSSQFWRPFKSARLKHWAVFTSSIATGLSVSALPTLASSILKSTPNSDCDGKPSTGTCFTVRKYSLHSFECIIIICTICAICLLSIIGRRQSGLASDPRGISGIAAMAVASHILNKFKGMDVASHETLHKRLDNLRFKLVGNAMIPIDNDKQAISMDRSKIVNGESDDDDLADSSKGQNTGNPHPFYLRWPYLLLYIVCVLAYVVCLVLNVTVGSFIHWTGGNSWIFTLLFTLVKLGWDSVDKTMRMTEPYYILSKRHAPPLTLMLDYTAIPFGQMPIRALFNKHWLMGSVGIGSVVVECLRAMASGVTFFKWTKGMDNNMGKILIGALIVASLYPAAVAGFVLCKRRRIFAPRQPNTISSTLAYIHQSKMLRDFEGTSHMTLKQMEDHLKTFKKTYGLGSFRGLDGKRHVGVDEEDLDGDFRHGMDVLGMEPAWTRQWDRY